MGLVEHELVGGCGLLDQCNGWWAQLAGGLWACSCWLIGGLWARGLSVGRRNVGR